MSSLSPAMASPFQNALRQTAQRVGPLGLIILLHIGFFYALQSGLLRDAAQVVLPKTVMVSFITPEQPKPVAQPPAPTPPKTVPVVKKAVKPPPAPPKVNDTPSEKAISTPPAPPAPPVQSEPVPAGPAPSAPTQAAPVAPAQPKTISSGIQYVEPPQPTYPPAARRMGEEGKVTLRVLVNEKGRPERVEVQKTSGSPRLDEAARQAAMRAVFKPHIEDGRAVAVFAIIPIRFQLDS